MATDAPTSSEAAKALYSLYICSILVKRARECTPEPSPNFSKATHSEQARRLLRQHLIIMSETPPKAQVEDDQTSKDSSEATAPQASPKKMPNSQFHHHVVPTEKSGALNVYVQVGIRITY